MKVFSIVMKIVAALALIAGIVYIVATYGDKIVAWAKKLLGKAESCCCEDECTCEGECTCDEDCCEEAPAEEATAEEVPAEGEFQAEEADFEG